MFYTYIIQYQTNGKYYTGSTNDLEDRIKRHQHNLNKATKGTGPWILVFHESFHSRSEAVKREFKIKKRGAGRFLNDLSNTG
jgi:putative endonuclease